MKAKIFIFIFLTASGVLLGTLGNISFPVIYNVNAFWPGAVVQVCGAVLFGWPGILAGTMFPVIATLISPLPSIFALCFIPANFVQGYLAYYLFRRFNCDINLSGYKSIIYFSFLATIIPQFCGGLFLSAVLFFTGSIINLSQFFMMSSFWTTVGSPSAIIFGIPIIRIFAPILKDNGLLFGQKSKNRGTAFTKNVINMSRSKGRKSLPVFIKIFLSLLTVGIIPISFLGAYEIIINNPSVARLDINAFFVCFGFFATLMLTGILTKAIITPLKKLSHGISKMKEGSFDYQVETTSDDELGQLAEGFNVMAKTVKDNIQQKEAYMHEKEVYMKKVAENEKLAVIGGLASTVAHDVRNPFKKIKLMLEMFPRLTPEQVKEYSEDMDMTIRKVEAMLSDITESAREKEYELISGNILCALDLAIKDVSRYRPDESIDFYYDFDTIALVDLDEQRICRAFENIINNAFDFLPEEKAFMWFSAKEQNNEAKIIIGNAHSHIPEDKIQEIFKASFTSGKQKGTGLGLSIVDKVVRGHHGTVIARNVEKVPGFVPDNMRNIQGVEFVITLPLSDKPGYSLKDHLVKNSQEAKADLGMTHRDSQFAGSSEIDSLINNLKAQAEKPNLLILDDESIYRMRVRGTLENVGSLNSYIHTIDASNYKEATELINHAKIDYLICDIDLGDKRNNGFAVLAEAIKKFPDCKVLVHTNRNEPKDIEQAKKLGACGFCPKPITEAILVDFLLKKELWPSNFRKKQSSETKTGEYIEAMPNTNILIVNDDLVALELNLVMMKSLIEPKDNVRFYKAKDYQEAKSVIEEIRPHILISDYNLETKETGIDACRFLKEKKDKSISVLYSGMTQNELEKLKKKNSKWIDEVFSTSCDVKNMLNTAFGLLREINKNQSKKLCDSVLPPEKIKSITHTETWRTLGKELVLCTISALYGNLDNITAQVEEAPELLDDIEKFKNEFASVVKDMSYIENMHDAIVDYLENNKKIDLRSMSELTKIKQLLNMNSDNKSAIRNPQSETSKEYLKILHLLRHDVTSNISIVKNFIIGIEMFAENMGSEVKLFAKENVIKLQGLNEAVITVKNMLSNATLKPNAGDIRFMVKDIIKKSMNKILSLGENTQKTKNQ